MTRTTKGAAHRNSMYKEIERITAKDLHIENAKYDCIAFKYNILKLFQQIPNTTYINPTRFCRWRKSNFLNTGKGEHTEHAD